MFRAFPQLRAGDVLLYQACDRFSGAVILLMAVFSPWVFGTTETWSISLMNFAGYFLGALLLLKLFLRKIKKFPAPRWDLRVNAEYRVRKSRKPPRAATRTLGWLTLVVLVYCLIHTVNAAATYDPAKRLFNYHNHIGWLPHSFDGQRSWFYFCMYLGLASTFWSLRDWLLGQTANEQRKFQRQSEEAAPAFPERMRRLIGLLAISGLVLGIECILQRAAGSNNLLFLVHPLVNPEGVTQFGPYAYRSNAAQYFNLLWPLCLGIWWWRCDRDDGKANWFLPAAAALMAACPIISTSRGGAMVSAGLLVLMILIFLGTKLARKGQASPGPAAKDFGRLAIFVAIVAGLGWYFGWAKLSPRMEEIGGGFAGREEMYAAARPMAEDYPLFGTGPGTFGTVFQLYLISNDTYWPEQLHNDWLETQITFGWTGMLLLLAMLGCVATAALFAPRKLAVAAGLALAGCLIHARFDFPLQIHSILFLFLLICALLLALAVIPRRSQTTSLRPSPSCTSEAAGNSTVV